MPFANNIDVSRSVEFELIIELSRLGPGLFQVHTNYKEDFEGVFQRGFKWGFKGELERRGTSKRT